MLQRTIAYKKSGAPMSFISQNYKSIRRDIFRSSIVLTLLLMFLFGAVLSLILYRSGMDAVRSIIKQRNYAVSNFIDGYFVEVKNVVETLAKHKDVRYGAQLSEAKKDRLRKEYKQVAQRHKYVTYLFSGYKSTKELIIDDYTVPDGYDPTVRPWYVAAVKAYPKASTGVPYHDAATHEWLLSTSKVLHDDEGYITGVFGCDSSIDIIMDQLSKRGDIYQSSYSFVVNSEDRIILHPIKAYLGKDVSEIAQRDLSNVPDEGYIEYEVNGVEKVAFFNKATEADWRVVTTVERYDVIKDIFYEIGLYAFCIFLICVVLGFVQSSILSKKFSLPLEQLHRKVKSVAEGHWESEDDTPYPNNEIGMISQDIEKLTTEELYSKSKELKRLNALLEERATTDQLTGVSNRHKIDEDLEHLYQRLARYNQPFSIMLLDLDWFKQVNDTHGHQMGDTTLKELASVLRESVRSIDSVGRWGGEEFMIVCPETHLEEVRMLAERIRTSVERHEFTIGERVTISVGVAQCSRAESIENVIRRADKNLYSAKESGRNRVV